MVCRLVTVVISLHFLVGAARGGDPPADPAVTLAQILAGKGAITAADVSAVTAASADRRVTALAEILERRGVLSSAEIAAVWHGGTGPAESAVTATAPVAPAAPAAAVPRVPQVNTVNLPVTSKEGVGVSLYGTLLFNSFYNTVAGNIEDIPVLVNKQGSDLTRGGKNFGATARQTRLGLKLREDNVLGGTLGGSFEFDLFGGKTPVPNGIDMEIFRLRLAYGRIDWKHAAFEAGQDWAIFAPLNPTSLAAYAVAEFATSGNPWIRLPQIRGEFKLGAEDEGHLLWQVAALDPNMGDYPTATFSASRQPGTGERGRMPALESRLAWTARHDGRDFTLGLSGHYGRGKNYGSVNGLEVFAPVDSWGVAVDYSLPFSRFLNLSGEVFEGRALGIFSVTSGEAVGPVGAAGQHGVESRGGWAQAQFNVAKKWQVNLGYGIESPNASELAVGNRWRNQTYMGNLMYKLTHNITLAWEYRRLLTDYRSEPFANERGGHANLAVAYSF